MSTFNDLQIIGEFYGVTANKGDIIVNNGTKNAPLSVGLDTYVLTADSAQPLGVKWAQSSAISIYSSQYVLNTPPVATNSTSPVQISTFTITPPLGNYVVLADFAFSMSKFDGRATFGMYKNNILISESSRTVDTFKAFFRTTTALSVLAAFSGSDVFTFKINTNNLDTDLTLHEGSIIFIRFSNVAQYAISDSNFATNYTLPITISDMNSTPQLGVYLVLFNCTFFTTLNEKTVTFGMYKNDILVSGTTRTISPIAMLNYSFEVHHVVSFTGSETFAIKVNTSDLDVDVVISNRALLLVVL